MCIPAGKERKWLPSSIPNPTGPPQPGKPPCPGLEDLCKNLEFKRLVLQDMNRLAKSEKLRGFEVVKNIYLLPEAFSVANGLLTPTFKIKRNEAKVFLFFSLMN